MSVPPQPPRYINVWVNGFTVSTNAETLHMRLWCSAWAKR